MLANVRIIAFVLTLFMDEVLNEREVAHLVLLRHLIAPFGMVMLHAVLICAQFVVCKCVVVV